jgi:hypothetical protein
MVLGVQPVVPRATQLLKRSAFDHVITSNGSIFARAGGQDGAREQIKK